MIPEMKKEKHLFRNASPRGSVVEHFLGKEGVTGSIPVVGSIYLNRVMLAFSV
jgi:hypothetical protein